MRCKSCDYALWNLRSRVCPECGTGFRPGEFEFVPNSVQFCCPGCGQDYYGTGPRGHLVPESFACVRCGAAVRMDDMVLLPTAGIAEERTQADAVPWLDKRRRRFVSRWMGTIGMALAMPGRLARALPGDAGVASAMAFSLLTGTLYAALGGAVLLIPLVVVGVAGGVGGLIAVLVAIALVPVGLAAAICAWGLMAHAILRLSGPTAAGPGRTFICLSYASGCNVLLAIPCMGLYLLPVSWVWWAIASAVMLAPAQRVSGVRAAAAAVVPPLLAVLAVAAWIGLSVAPQIRAGIAAARPALAAANAPGATTRVLAGLQAYCAANAAAPPHALALLADQHLFLPDLFLDGGPSGDADGVVAGVDVSTVQFLTPEERAGAVTLAAGSLAPGAASHRLGDMVFVYHGIDCSPGTAADPGLWLVICAPRAALSAPSGQPAAPLPITVGTLGSGIRMVPPASWAAQLGAQNRLRAAAGLGPLADPFAPLPPDPGTGETEGAGGS